ncbi:hypothetical protein [Candidatus Mycoplasma haematohominis]|uniref:Uncharacterized protein n=1 Tax=Candidatus Mycoplasma haematohominis TaxID=1494318 RepID=A0A478FPV2_9MOLU|nr:hypothetical protein [Candidatus Mycoplasma haemohominis]GCE63077.1 hypothetical protein MHSWG343_00550 [Candidatus Mycoplasma haemohominis]
MPSPAAVGGGALGAAAVGVGGAYLAGAFEGSGSSKVESEPTRVLLSGIDGFSQAYENANGVGKLYGKYLVAPYGSRGNGVSQNVTRPDNKDWWEWSYKRWKWDSEKIGDSLSIEFKDDKKINAAFSDSTTTSNASPKALNQVCDDVYKGNQDSITPEENFSGNKTKLKNDLWKYCSILGEVKTIAEVSAETYDGTNKKGADATNIKKFIAITGNDKFWEIRNQEFYATSNPGEKSRSKATSDSSKFKTDSDGTSKKNIRNICQEAYKFEKSNGTDYYPDAEISRFCVL